VPAAMVVLDRVVSANPAFRKYWLLHTQEEPRLDGTSAVVDCTQYGNSGRLTLDVLLPRGAPAPEDDSSRVEGVPPSNRGQDARDTGGGATLTKVGGPGKEYWVFGQNWANDVDPQRLERTSLEPGAWRIELSPKTASAEDLFLNVMQVTDRQSPSRWPVRRLDAGDRVGCVIEGPEVSWVVLMRRDSQRSAAPVKFTVAGGRPGRILVTDLASGQWHAQQEGSAEMRSLAVSEDSGSAWFEGSAGAWTLFR
jgi:hypothetical protein